MLFFLRFCNDPPFLFFLLLLLFLSFLNKGKPLIPNLNTFEFPPQQSISKCDTRLPGVLPSLTYFCEARIFEYTSRQHAKWISLLLDGHILISETGQCLTLSGSKAYRCD